MKDLERNRITQAKRAARRRKMGMCTRCGAEAHGKALCDRCSPSLNRHRWPRGWRPKCPVCRGKVTGKKFEPFCSSACASFYGIEMALAQEDGMEKYERPEGPRALKIAEQAHLQNRADAEGLLELLRKEREAINQYIKELKALIGEEEE